MRLALGAGVAEAVVHELVLVDAGGHVARVDEAVAAGRPVELHTGPVGQDHAVLVVAVERVEDCLDPVDLPAEARAVQVVPEAQRDQHPREQHVARHGVAVAVDADDHAHDGVADVLGGDHLAVGDLDRDVLGLAHVETEAPVLHHVPRGARVVDPRGPMARRDVERAGDDRVLGRLNVLEPVLGHDVVEPALGAEAPARAHVEAVQHGDEHGEEGEREDVRQEAEGAYDHVEERSL